MLAGQSFKYGYKWWLYPRKEPGKFIWMGRGFGGQRLMVFPEEKMIVTFTGWEIIKDKAPSKALGGAAAGRSPLPGCGSETRP